MNITRLATLSAACTLALASATAFAATDATNFKVKVVITESCDVHTGAATDVDFGAHSRYSSDLSASGNLVVNCSAGTPYTIALNDGQHATAATSASNRRMTDGANNYVPYGLYQDSAASKLWGSTAGTNTLPSTGTGANQNIPVYGKVTKASINVPSGTYSDAVTATVQY